MLAGNYFEQLLNHLEEVVVCYDDQVRYVFLNQVALKYARLKKEDMLGKFPSEVFSKHGERTVEVISRVIHQNETHRGDYSFEFEGKTVTLDVVIKPMSLDGRQYAVAICRDVTEYRKHINDLLKQNENALVDIQSQKILFENVVMNNPYALGYANTDRRFIVVNEAFDRIFGYEPGELIGASAAVIYPDQGEYIRLANERFNQNGTVNLEPVEVILRKKNGDTFPAEIVGTPLLDANSKTVGFLGCIRDLTYEKAMQKRLEEERAKNIHASRMATLGEMAAGVAHEINNPLEIINSCSSIILRQAESGEVEQDALTFAGKKIQQTVFRIANIVKALRNISREGTNDPVELVVVEELITEVLELSAKRFEVHGITLDVEWEIEPRSKFFCRRVEISQVLLNLLSNAFDAVFEIKAGLVKLRVYRDVSDICFEVIDNGGPIPEAIAEKIMDPFFTTKELGKGTGLGLSISKAIVDRHHGRLEYSQKEKNTCFTICLPINSSAAS